MTQFSIPQCYDTPTYYSKYTVIQYRQNMNRPPSLVVSLFLVRLLTECMKREIQICSFRLRKKCSAFGHFSCIQTKYFKSKNLAYPRYYIIYIDFFLALIIQMHMASCITIKIITLQQLHKTFLNITFPRKPVDTRSIIELPRKYIKQQPVRRKSPDCRLSR